jgi:hypothetical protein
MRLLRRLGLTQTREKARGLKPSLGAVTGRGLASYEDWWESDRRRGEGLG